MNIKKSFVSIALIATLLTSGCSSTSSKSSETVTLKAINTPSPPSERKEITLTEDHSSPPPVEKGISLVTTEQSPPPESEEIKEPPLPERELIEIEDGEIYELGENGCVSANEEIALVSESKLYAQRPGDTTVTFSDGTVKNVTVYKIYPKTYWDESINITVDKVWYETAWCYIAHVVTTDYSRIGTGCANGKCENGYDAERLGAILTVNGDVSSPYSIIMRDNAVAVNGQISCGQAYYNKYNGLFGTSEMLNIPSGYNAEQAMSGKLATDTIQFGGSILLDGEITIEKDTTRHQRTCIGTTGKQGELYILVTEGRYSDKVSAGETSYDCAKLLKEYGCVYAVLSDGGESSSMVFMGKRLNHLQRENERSLLDFLYVY